MREALKRTHEGRAGRAGRVLAFLLVGALALGGAFHLWAESVSQAGDYYLVKDKNGNVIIGYGTMTPSELRGTVSDGALFFETDARQLYAYDRSTNTWTVGFSGVLAALSDAVFTVCDDGDPTKCAKFETSGLTTGTTRTFTLPDDSSTLMTIGSSYGAITGNWNQSGNYIKSGSNMATDVNVGYSVGANSATFGLIINRTALTPDGPIFATGTDSNSWHITERGDISFDFNNGPCGTSACTSPTVIIHSEDQNTTDWLAFWHDGTNANIDTGAGSIVFADAISAGSLFSSSLYGHKASTTNVGDLVATFSNCGRAITNLGDTDGSTITLWDDPTVIGCKIHVGLVAAQSVVITPASGETLYLGTDQCAVSLSSSSIGANVEIMSFSSGSGAVWIASGDVGSTGFTCNDA